MINFIGCLSHLTEVSGISEVLGSVYVPNARKHAFRKSYAKLQVGCYNFEIKFTSYLTINQFESYISNLELKKSWNIKIRDLKVSDLCCKLILPTYTSIPFNFDNSSASFRGHRWVVRISVYLNFIDSHTPPILISI